MNKPILKFHIMIKKGNTRFLLTPEKQQIEFKMVETKD